LGRAVGKNIPRKGEGAYMNERERLKRLREEVLEWGGELVKPMEAYTDIFKLGRNYIQRTGEEAIPGHPKSNPVGYRRDDGAEHGYFHMFKEDTFEENLRLLQNADFSILSGLAYLGKKNLIARANRMYAMIFDIDGITEKTLVNFLHAASNGVYPLPQYLVLSGHGMHLYYVFDEPIHLFKNTKKQLKDVKFELTKLMWNRYTSTEDKVQYQGINQGFRVIGGKSKVKGVRVEAFRINHHPATIDEMLEYIDQEQLRIDLEKRIKESKMTLEQAREAYPDWYNKQVVPHMMSQAGKEIKTLRVAKNRGWKCHPGLYEWWLKKIEKGATVGSRYYCILSLAAYAQKSGISKEKLREDAYKLLPRFNLIGFGNEFREIDVENALAAYDKDYKELSIDTIVKLTKIEIKKNKRNYKKQKWHLEDIRDVKLKMQEREIPFKNPEGRPEGSKKRKHLKRMDEIEEYVRKHPESTVKQVAEVFNVSMPTEYMVKNYKRLHPESNVTEIAEALGVTRPTVYKYLKEMGENG